GLRHRIPAHPLKDPRTVAAVLHRLRRKHGTKLVDHHLPCGIGRLTGKKWPLARRAFAPAGQALGANFGQQDAAVGGYAKAGFKWAYKGKMKLAQNNCVNSHENRFLWPTSK